MTTSESSALASLYALSTASALMESLVMPRPPRTMKGEIRVTTMASCQEKMKQIAQEAMRPKSASQIMPIDSVVSPFTAAMSSIKRFVRTPGARSFESNQPTCLRKIDSNNWSLKV